MNGANKKFETRVEYTERGTVYYLTGELDLSMAAELRQSTEKDVQNAGNTLVFNLQDLSYIDSTGIGVIISILKARNSLQAPFELEQVPQKIKRLFDITGITKFLTIGMSNAN